MRQLGTRGGLLMHKYGHTPADAQSREIAQQRHRLHRVGIRQARKRGNVEALGPWAPR